MDRLERFMSRPAAKPYRTRNLEAGERPTLDHNGHLTFSENDLENPQNWSKARRWYVCSVAVLLVVNATFASSSPSGCIESIADHFKVSTEAAGLVITLFLLGYVFGPLFWAPMSENYGRRWIFLGSFILYVIFNFLCAWANNFGALLVGRFLTGTFASSSLSNSPGVLADVFSPLERGNAMAIFSLMTFVGPALGPVISGFIQLKLSWEWSFYVLLWLGGLTIILLLTIPETYGPTILLHKARRLRASKVPGFENVQAPVEASGRTLGSLFRVALTRPWRILVDPISLLIAFYLSIVYMLLYMLFSIYPIIFQEKRGYNSGVGELPLIGVVIGAGIACIIIFNQTRLDRKRVEAGETLTPEDRLPTAMIGGIIFPLTMFWFCWSGEYSYVHWIVPTLAGVFLATSIMLIFVSYLNYLADVYKMYAASALAANTVCRSACGAAAPLFTGYMFSSTIGLGVGGGGSLIAGVGCLLAPIPFVFYKYGAKIRERSKFAPTEGGAGPKPPGAQGSSEAEKDEKSGDRSTGSGDELDSASRTSTSTLGDHDTAANLHSNAANAATPARKDSQPGIDTTPIHHGRPVDIRAAAANVNTDASHVSQP
ncbi:hypothetical protein PYCC9005_000161 [Savitreella phatthalungensis]